MLSVNPIGRSGGLAIFWTTTCRIQLTLTTKNVLDARVFHVSQPTGWRLLCIYGHPNEACRILQWRKMSAKGTCITKPWLCIGDFNVILSSAEKESECAGNLRRIENFRSMVNCCSFIDLDFQGPKHTWFNNHQNQTT